MRTVYLGTSDFAATVLRRLAESPHRPALVVTPPDRPRGRGRKLASPPAAEAARELGIELLQTPSVNEPDAAARVLSTDAGAGVVCAFGQLIKDPVLSDLELLNVHPSLLPRWRGAAPIERALMAGDAETGVTIIRLTEGLDSGPIALQETLAIAAGEGAGSLIPRLAELGGELVVRALELREAGELELREQDDDGVTYAEKIGPEDRRLDPARPAVELVRIVRALTPHIGAHLDLEGGERLRVTAAEVWAPATAGADPGPAGTDSSPGGGDAPADADVPPVPLTPGQLSGRYGELLLGTGDGVLSLIEVQPPGKRPMPAEAYLRGHPAPGRAV